MIEPRERLGKLAERYQRFAEVEARGVSPTYEKLALAISSSIEILEFIARLPEDRQQPNLFLAATRKVAGVPRSCDHLVEIVRQRPNELRTILLSRTTQTNEPARCAVLLPARPSLPQPLALLEVGASAGLCLIPDRYGYDYGRVRVMPRPGWDGHGLVFPCEANDAAPLPLKMPTIAWRRGPDLHPLDVRSQQHIDCLQTPASPHDLHQTERPRPAVATAPSEPA